MSLFIHCILSFFIIKPQHHKRFVFRQCHCILSFFIIKPQPRHQCPASLRNCILSFFIIKPQLLLFTPPRFLNCILSFFIIKPQLTLNHALHSIIVSYLFSSSNHNKHSLFCLFLVYYNTLVYARSGLTCILSMAKILK